MRDELLSILEKNSRIAFSELAVLLGTTEEEALKLVDNIFEYYKAEAELGEKLGLMIERVGVENFIEKVKLR